MSHTLEICPSSGKRLTYADVSDYLKLLPDGVSREALVSAYKRGLSCAKRFSGRYSRKVLPVTFFDYDLNCFITFYY